MDETVIISLFRFGSAIYTERERERDPSLGSERERGYPVRITGIKSVWAILLLFIFTDL